MSRYALVAGDDLLDAAERLVRRCGVAALSFDGVAKEAGVSKGGVQSHFGSKTRLLEALFKRCVREFDEQVEAQAGASPTRLDLARAHVSVTAHATQQDANRAAGLMAGLLQAPDELAPVREWYQSVLAGLDLSTLQGRQARLAILATEGAFLLRNFGFMEVSDADWTEMFKDIQNLLANPAG